MYKQGEIVIIKFPFTDGSEFKRRPALIISNQLANKTGDYILVQITSKFIDDNLSIKINKNDCLKELPLQSYLRAHKIFTVNSSLIISKLTNINSEFKNKVVKKIAQLIQ